LRLLPVSILADLPVWYNLQAETLLKFATLLKGRVIKRQNY